MNRAQSFYLFPRLAFYKVAVLLVAIFSVAPTTYAANSKIANGKLVLAVEDSWPPFANADGTGLSRTIIEKAMEGSNLRLEFIVVPYARALKMAEDGVVDGAFNVTQQGSTLQKFKFGKYPLLQAKASFFYSSNNLQNYKDINAVPSGTSIGLIIGYEYGDEYEQQRRRFNEVRVSHQSQIIEMLHSGRIEMAIMFDKVADDTLKQMNHTARYIRKGHLNHVSDIYVGFSKRVENIQTKIDALDKGLRRLKQGSQGGNGTIQYTNAISE